MPDPNYMRLFWRRLAALCYDVFLLFSLLLVVTAILLPFNRGEAFNNNPFYGAILLLVIGVFYLWFWTHGGQTLGMRAWSLRLTRTNTLAVGWVHAVQRLIWSASCLLPPAIVYFASQQAHWALSTFIVTALLWLLLSIPDYYADTRVIFWDRCQEPGYQKRRWFWQKK